MDIDELTRAIERLVPEPYISGYLEVVEYYKSACINRDEARKELVQCELSRTELIKQNAALAAENERLEVKLADSESGSISWRKSYHIALEKLVAARAVIKAAQEPAYELNYQYDEGKEDPELGGDLIFHQLNGVDYPPGALFYAGPVPAQSSETRSSLPDNVTRVVDASTGQVKNSVPAVAVPDGWEQSILYAMDDGFRIRRQHGGLHDDALVNDDTQIGVEFAIKHMKAMLLSSHDRCPSHEPVEDKKLYRQVSNWYARLTNAEVITDNDEHAGYCCTMKMMDEMEDILSVGLPEVMQACGVQDGRWLQDEAGKCADSCKDWPDWRKNAVTAEQDSGVVDHD